MIEDDPEFQAYVGLKQAMERVATYAGQDGKWYASIRTKSGLLLEGPFRAEDEAQEAGLRVAMDVGA